MRKLGMTLTVLATLTAGLMADGDLQTQPQTQTTQNGTSTALIQQMQQLQNADTNKRVEIMNQIKEQIASMTPQQRQQAMQELHRQMRSREGSEHANDRQMMQKMDRMLQEHTQIGAMNRDHASEMGMNAQMQMERKEHMNQKEAGERFREHRGGGIEHGNMGTGNTNGPIGHNDSGMQDRNRDMQNTQSQRGWR